MLRSIQTSKQIQLSPCWRKMQVAGNVLCHKAVLQRKSLIWQLYSGYFSWVFFLKNSVRILTAFLVDTYFCYNLPVLHMVWECHCSLFLMETTLLLLVCAFCVWRQGGVVNSQLKYLYQLWGKWRRAKALVLNLWVMTPYGLNDSFIGIM